MSTITQYKIRDARRDHPKWFSTGAVRFFNGKNHRQFPTPSALYLVHSVQYDETTERQYKVARFSADRCDGIGPLTGFDGGQKEAEQAAFKLASLEINGRIEERSDAHERFVACHICVSDGKEHPGWATYLLQPSARHSTVIDICSEHLARGSE